MVEASLELPLEGQEEERAQEQEPQLPLLTPEGLKPALNPILVEDGKGLEKLEAFFPRIAAEEKFPSFEMDYETNMADVFWDRKARVLAVGNKQEQYIIDFRAFAETTENLLATGNFKTPKWAEPILKVLRPVMESKAFLKVGQNLGFEYEVSSWNLGFRPWNLYSIDIAERVIWAGLHTFKDLKFYSLDRMTQRYFGKRVDKTKQTTFDLESRLTEEDLVYSCFDLRLPRAIRQLQTRTLIEDNLYRVTKIENDAIGAFVDMHLTGMRIDRAAWAALIAEWSVKYRHALEQLDTHFVPVVGRKHVPDGDLQLLFDGWKELTEESPRELELKAQRRATKKGTPERESIDLSLAQATTDRKAGRDDARDKWQTLKTRQNKARDMMDDCAGEAFINYGSPAQLHAAMLKMKGFTATNLPSTVDDALKKHRTKPVVINIRDFRKYEKLLQTYGESWITEWRTKPSNDEGWLCPHDQKIHSIINQLEAETGRTSSVKPNSQNLPHDPRVRACFIADPPDESIRVSVCCDGDTLESEGVYVCTKCQNVCETKAEEYCIVTTDMSGAELRIIAEESLAKSWVEAFQKGWDVHSVGAELLYPELWPNLVAKEGDTFWDDIAKQHLPCPPCAYFHKDHKKCKCPRHLELRDANKSTNFLLAYGGGPPALAEAIDKTEDEASDLMALHRKKNPEVWDYLDAQGRKAVQNLEARDRAGRRRKFHEPNWEKAKERARERLFERLKKKNGGKTTDGVKLKLEDCNPTNEQIKSALRGMWGSIERMGKNMPIQSLNATIAKLVMGAGFDKDGKPYLWHLLAQYKAYLINFVHDEFVIHCPKRYATQVKAVVQDCIRRAAAEFMKVIPMESESRIANCWMK